MAELTLKLTADEERHLAAWDDPDGAVAEFLRYAPGSPIRPKPVSLAGEDLPGD